MSKEEAIQKIGALAEELKENGQEVAAGTLFALCGSMHTNAEVLLLKDVCEFSRKEIDRINSFERSGYRQARNV